MADSIKNEKLRMTLKFMVWVGGGTIMGSIEQRIDYLEKDDEFSFGHSKPDSMVYFQKILCWNLVYFEVL